MNNQLVRSFEKMGARVKLLPPSRWRQEAFNADVLTDKDGEYFALRVGDGVNPEIVDVQAKDRHLVMMVRDVGTFGRNGGGRIEHKDKYLCGHDERHWFVAPIPDKSVRSVQTAKASLRPAELRGKGGVIRQGEWFFEPVADLDESSGMIYRNEPLRASARSKPHVCEEILRRGGQTVWIAGAKEYTQKQYEEALASNPKAVRYSRSMVRGAEVFARGFVRHSDHATVHLDGWHRVYVNREGESRHIQHVSFLD